MKKIICAAGLVVAGVGVMTARADVTIRTEETMLMAGQVLSSSVTCEMIKGDCSRTAIEMKTKPFLPIPVGPDDLNTTAIYRFDLGCIWILHPGDSSYIERIQPSVGETITPKVGDQQSLDSAVSPRMKSMNWPKIGDRQSLDSALTPETELPPWRVDSVVWRHDAHLNVPCRVASAYGHMLRSDRGRRSAATFEVWFISDEAGVAELVRYRRRCGEAAGLPADYLLGPFDIYLAQFGLSRVDMGLDTVTGIPLKAEIIMTADLSKEDVAEITAPTAADDSLSWRQPSFDSAARAMDMSDSLKESITSHYEELTQKIFAGLKPGGMELLHFTQSVVSIDTTALADSLFEIPPGYKKQ
jgi:hypothetical protein